MQGRGFVLTLDAAVAALLAVLIVGFALDLSGSVGHSPRTEESMLVAGYDVAAALVHTGALGSMDAGSINSLVNATLPVAYGMRVEAATYRIVGGNLTRSGRVAVGAEPSGLVVVRGKRTFVTSVRGQLEYGEAEFWVWLR